MWGDIAIAFLLAFITSYVITPYTIRLAYKIGALDLPTESRKIHTKKMPRLGGIAVIIGFIVSIIYLLFMMSAEHTINLFSSDNYFYKLLGFTLGALVLSIACFIDDWKSIKPYVKLAFQIVAAIIVVSFGIRIDKIVIGSYFSITNNDMLLNIITVIWIVGITNAINLIDGLDGLSTGLGIISCISLLIIFSLNGSPLISILLITALRRCINRIYAF